jgi:hypothetical protein
MKMAWFIVALLISYLFYGLYLNHLEPSVIPGVLNARETEGFHDYSGVINIHSRSSEGAGYIEEIVTAGQQAGLDFLFVTDLNQFSNKDKSWQGYHNNLLVFIDGAYSYLNSRLLNLGVKAPRDISGPGRAQVFFTDMLSQGQRSDDLGIFVLAHPLRSKYTWVGDYPPGLDGIEIFNLKSIWQQSWTANRGAFLWSLFVLPFNDRLALLRIFQDPEREIELWDELNAKRPTLGFGGADADARIPIFSSWSLHYPSYSTIFSLMRNHVLLPSELTGDSVTDQEKILGALRRGQFYVSLDILGNPKGFSAVVGDDSGAALPLGSRIMWREGLELKVHLPERPTVPFEVEVYRDGKRIYQGDTQDTRLALHSPGVYRVKVRVMPRLPFPDGRRWLPWIYTNAFYLLK